MIKRFISIALFIGMFVIASCAASPQKSYTTDMKPAMELLAKSQADYANLERLLTDPSTTSINVTRLDIIDLYNMAAQNKLSREDYINLGLVPLDDLISPSAKLSKDGHQIIDLLSKVTPLEETKSDHQVVLTCVQARVAFAEELTSALKNLSPIDMNKAGELSNCEKFDSSLQALTAFVSRHQ